MQAIVFTNFLNYGTPIALFRQDMSSLNDIARVNKNRLPSRLIAVTRTQQS